MTAWQREAKAVESGSETVIETSRGGGRGRRRAHYGRDRTGDELPAELERSCETRLKKIREAKGALEERARQKAAAEGSNRKQAKPKEKDQYNFTEF